ncbi:hypothetical protein [Cryobacterium sp. 10C3]|uniref:hypothetical protein n=1 Tax=Cryobacterium sp. 10C3 TaxID=3048577 RepID=UPI002AB48B34|nr:hypothetical protein [Cryobacterium sp. 10C3]MDY7556633.1 hypothetical protein [Cryobacterium sp. 10C3]
MKNTPNLPIETLLESAASAHSVAPSQMMYALSFADVKNLVEIDYDAGTVSLVAAKVIASRRAA